MRHLVLVHGRSQEDKDSVALKAEWLGALETGLTATGRTLPISESDVRFPYYGDTLDHLTRGARSSLPDVVVRGDADASAAPALTAFTKDVLTEAARTSGAR